MLTEPVHSLTNMMVTYLTKRIVIVPIFAAAGLGTSAQQAQSELSDHEKLEVVDSIGLQLTANDVFADEAKEMVMVVNQNLEGRALHNLTPLSQSACMLDDDPTFRLMVVVENGKTIKVVGMYEGGSTDKNVRDTTDSDNTSK